ncbi:putative tail protein [Uncultured Caudovirales phage clone 2F_1]|uniref:Tail protein n=1 Tax=Uncultured Caudovirales phage clone 2F_1 TaxID=2992576 RepID=A0A2H4JDV2_9CAUD|nr:phage tail protein [Acinetobacter radioresistens]YP_010092454.1 tail collar fiber protein [Uncultured Caudovirales phage clone 2F_1]ASN71627.1 putative tail protein [Uncultured Caudovirales phage clone 2F_1]RJL74424.1 hypothetical protein D5055_02805 [Acinetobacter radioresistens]
MTAKYYIALTDYGAELIAKAHQESSIALAYLVIGDANGIPYDPLDKKNLTSLINQCAQVPIQTVEIIDTVTRVTATVNSEIGGFNIHEIGLTDSSGKLVYIGNYHGAYKPVITDGGSGELEIVIDIKTNTSTNVLIQIDPNIVTANKKWVEKEVAKLELKFNSLVEAIYHVESWHGSNKKDYDPSLFLEPLFGYRTSWMIWPYIPAGVESVNDPLGTISELQIGNSSRQASSTRIWQRLPDGSSPPSYTLTVNKSIANEGDEVIFTLITTGLNAGTPVDWTITGLGIKEDDFFPRILSGQFVVDTEGKAVHSIQITEDNKTEGDENLVFSLKYIKNKQVSVLIKDTSKYPEGSSVYYEGTHQIEILPNQTVKFHLHGPCGGGGGSIYSGTGTEPDGQNAGDVSCTIGTSTLIAGGGKAGTGGVWGNGSSYTEGKPGTGGITSVNDPEAIFDELEITNGIDAILYSRWETQKGASALPAIIGQMSGGGNGAVGIGDERHSFGGAAGSGARIRAMFTNTTEEKILASIDIGKLGEGWKSWGNKATDGGIGFAIVEIFNPD